MKQNFYFKSLLIALFVLFGGGVIHAAEETLYSESFPGSGNLILDTYNKQWTVVSGGYVKLQSNTRNVDQPSTIWEDATKEEEL